MPYFVLCNPGVRRVDTDNTGDLARSTPKANVCDWQWFAAVPVVERTIDMTIDMRTIAMLACGVV